jgi:hypothetical protein
MTPISFALEILLDCETIEDAHKKCRKYIKLLEGGKVPQARPTAPMPAHIAAQAPSTQRILNEMAAEGAMVLPPIQPPKIIGGEVNNGDGTRGKRKW